MRRKKSFKKKDRIGNFRQDNEEEFHADQGLGLVGKAVKPQKFEFEFEVSGSQTSSKKSKSRSKKRNIDGRRVLRKKPKPRYNIRGTFQRKRSNNLPPKNKKPENLPKRKMRRNNPFRTDFMNSEEEQEREMKEPIEEKYDEMDFEDQVEKLKREREELNRGLSSSKKSRSNTRHFDDDEGDLKDFEDLENELKNGSALNRFNSTGNQSSLPLEEDEFIEEKFQHNEDSKFYINNKSVDSSRLENDQGENVFNKTTRLDKFSKKSHPEDIEFNHEEEPRHTNMIDLDDFNNDMLQDSLEQFTAARSKNGTTPVKDITTFVDELVNNASDRSLRPYSPPTSNLIDLVDPNKTVITRKKDTTVVLDYTQDTGLKNEPQEEIKKKLEYDALLDCWYDPETGTYHHKR